MTSKAYIGDINLDNIKIGSSDLKMYLGDELIYPLTTPSTTFKYKVKFINSSTGVETEVEVPDDGTTTITQGMIQSDLQALGYNSMLFSEITFGDNITTIGSLAMLGTSSLSSVTLSNVTTLADHAFTVDENTPTSNRVTTINIPASLTSIDSTALIDMPLTGITVDSRNTVYTVKANTLVANGYTAVKGTTNSDLSNLLTITTIGAHAFEGVSFNTDQAVSAYNLDTIEEYAFYRAYLPNTGSTQTLMIGADRLQYIGRAAFASLNNRTGVDTYIEIPYTDPQTVQIQSAYTGGNGIFGGVNAANLYLVVAEGTVAQWQDIIETSETNATSKSNLDHVIDAGGIQGDGGDPDYGGGGPDDGGGE